MFNKAATILGMNARNQVFVQQNSGFSKRIAHSKISTKMLMQEKGIATPKIYQLIDTAEQVEEINWAELTENFVIKPTNGSGGKGIIVIRNQIAPNIWRDSVGESWSKEQLELHCLDILEGKYSTHALGNNQLIIEERVPIHPLFLKYTYGGTPDIRVIVYNSIPVMVMLRLPTKQSGGRANLHQGALGVGVDMATGITTYAITGNGIDISYVPGTKRKLNGIRLPFWKQVLQTAVEAANAAQVAYGGIDLFVHKEKGPMVVEINVRPGLLIQLANRQGLKNRLERVMGLNVLSAEHGVKIAQTLFDTHLSSKVMAADQKILIKPQLPIVIYDKYKQPKEITAQVATARQKSIIAADLAEELGLVNPDDLLWWTKESGGEKAPVIAATLNIAKQKIQTTLVVSKTLNRGKIKVKLGRDDLKQFLIEME